MASEDSTERYYADLETARNYHEAEYFKARPQLQKSLEQQVLFRAGFERGFKFLWQRFIDAQADMLRLHREFVDLKYPASEAKPTHRYLCRVCGWSGNELQGAPGNFMCPKCRAVYTGSSPN